MKFLWTQEQLHGYLQTWSAVEKYKQRKGNDPLALIESELTQVGIMQLRELLRFRYLNELVLKICDKSHPYLYKKS
jgi:hypothetical protein